MQKNAKPGERGIFNKLREMTNVSGKAAEKYFDPEFKKVMGNLRKVDNNLRSIVIGEPIGTEKDPDSFEEISGDPGKFKISLKQLLKQIKSNLNRKEYMKAAADLGIFHSKLNEINHQITTFDDKIDDVHHQFLFGTPDKKVLNEEQWQNLQDLQNRWKAAAHQREQQLIKEAGVVDFLKNVFTERGRALSAWEKRYPRQTATLKKDSEKLLKEGEAILAQTLAALKEMASARSVRNPDVYMNAAKKLVERNKAFDAKFKEFYTTNIQGFLEKAKALYPTKEVKDSKEMGSQDIPVGGKAPVVVPDDLSMPPPPGGAAPSGGTAPSAGLSMPPLPGKEVINVTPNTESTAPTTFPAPPGVPGSATLTGLGPSETARQTQGYGDLTPPSNRQTLMGVAPQSGGAGPTPVAPTPMTAAEREEFRTKMEAQHGISTEGNHKAFYKSLEKLSKEDPLILAAYIAKYAKAIQSEDTETSLKLFKIVKNIRG